MSEIKGQLLGILLVTAIFSGVAFAIKAVFTSLTDEVSSQVAGDLSAVAPTAPSNAKILLTY